MSGIGDLAKKLEALAEIPDQIAEASATKIKKSVARTYDAGTDPYGRAWVALKTGQRSRLNSSGKMCGTLDARTEGTQIKVELDFPYIFHAGGTVNMPARPVLTIGVMPETWSTIIEESFAEAVKKTKG